MKVKNLDPVWDETFDLPVAKPEHASLEASPFVVRCVLNLRCFSLVGDNIWFMASWVLF